MGDSGSHNELLKTHFLQGRERSLPHRKFNLNIFERGLSLSEKVHKLSNVCSSKSSKNFKQF